MFGTKDKVYTTIPLLSKSSLLFMKQIQPLMELKETRMASEKAMFKFSEVKSIEEH
jgi:hypothetical protein